MSNFSLSGALRRNWSAKRRSRSRTRLLNLEALETRAMFAGIPLLSSLPGAAHTIYLDFDGDFQTVWNRTDSNQTYTNVNVGEFNIDGVAGISASEESAIRKIWETVADDYAPFNVNVTTVAPSSFANRVALRVVMAGSSSATLRTSAGTTVAIPTRDVFISNDNGTMVDTSGYAAINSYTNAEPNVVYVFAKYMSTWGTTDSENRFRDLRAIIATSASHEAGHAFGLVHHGDYDLGTNITTPIMGSNTQGDRSLWSTYTSGKTNFDSLARLTSLFGARADDYSGTLKSATEFPIGYSPFHGYTGTVKGVVSTAADNDLFRLTTTAKQTYQMTVSVPQFGNLDSQLVFYVVRGGLFGAEYLEQAFVVDPAIPSSSPFSGLGATLKLQLPAGKYAMAVRSHGGYGDLGGYTLTVSIPSSQVFYDAGAIGNYTTMTSTTSTTGTYQTELSTATLSMKGSGAGLAASSPETISPSPMLQPAGQARKSRTSEHATLDLLFAAWPQGRLEA